MVDECENEFRHAFDVEANPSKAFRVIQSQGARIAALEAKRSENVKVKPLEWEEAAVGRWAARTEGFPFQYIVRINLKGHIRIKTFGLYEVFNGTLDEAFAYVQADHERRVRKLVGVN